MTMMDLDDVEALRALDAGDMLGTVAALGDHVRSGYAAGRTTTGLPSLEDVRSIVFCGMGGSAVAGDVLRQTFRDRLAVPVDVNRSPILPAHAGSQTLVLVSSFSGDTSETLSAAREAMRRGCRVIAITSGGQLGEMCAEHEIAVAPVPAGFQPRAALGHLTFAMLGALETAGLVPPLAADVEEAVSTIEQLRVGLVPEIPEAENPAKELATWLGDRIAVCWGAEGIGAVAAMRWKTQMNENGKVPAWNAAMSELDHNEVVGWVRPTGALHAVLALRTDHEHPELAARFPLSADIVRAVGAEVREVRVSGKGPLASLLSLVMLGDFATCYVGIRRGEDPTPVAVIGGLKAALTAADLG
ncbi:MAG: bifunctional phosphoglucose/phosphomannose isomerase [Actinomycetota bacterium]